MIDKVKAELDAVVELSSKMDYVSVRLIQEHCAEVLRMLKRRDPDA